MLTDNDPLSLMTPQDALIAIMIAASASDEDFKSSEMLAIIRIVNNLPIFAEYDADRIESISRTVFDLLEVEEGLTALFGLVKDALPAKLSETAYALACDVTAADGRLGQTELRFLQEIRYELNIDRLSAAAIEKGAQARHMTI